MRVVSFSNPIQVTLSLTIGTAISLKERGLLDVMALPGSAELFADVISDQDTFSRILWEMTDRSHDYGFFRAMVARSEQQTLWDQFRDEVLDFFQHPTKPRMVALANAIDCSESAMPSRIPNSQTMNGEQNENERLNEAGPPSGKWPEPSESILADSLYVSSTT